MTTLFSKRHYEWLARFAADAELSAATVGLLADELTRDNPGFDSGKFQRAVYSRPNHTMPRE